MEWTVSSSGRLDAFLAEQAEGFSRSKLQKLIKDGKVWVNGEIVKKSAFSLREGDTVSIVGDVAEEQTSTMQPADLGLAVLYEDDACLVIDKPAGFAVHPGAAMDQSEQTILHGIVYLFKERSIPFSEDAVLVHRLDKETTGCLLIAKTHEAHEFLQKQFEERSVSKTYLALVAGVPSPSEAMIDAPIGRNLTDRTRMSILKTSVSREAKTTYRTIEATDKCALLQCDLHTGRTHQVRVHLSSIGHPILGDATYRSSMSDSLSEEYDVSNLCLHAWKLKFVSPVDSGQHEVVASIPSSFQETLRSVGIDRTISY